MKSYTHSIREIIHCGVWLTVLAMIVVLGPTAALAATVDSTALQCHAFFENMEAGAPGWSHGTRSAVAIS